MIVTPLVDDAIYYGSGDSKSIQYSKILSGMWMYNRLFPATIEYKTVHVTLRVMNYFQLAMPLPHTLQTSRYSVAISMANVLTIYNP